jgi:hypothetical protein
LTRGTFEEAATKYADTDSCSERTEAHHDGAGNEQDCLYFSHGFLLETIQKA